jgi:hypothetical protein
VREIASGAPGPGVITTGGGGPSTPGGAADAGEGLGSSSLLLAAAGAVAERAEGGSPSFGMGLSAIELRTVAIHARVCTLAACRTSRTQTLPCGFADGVWNVEFGSGG